MAPRRLGSGSWWAVQFSRADGSIWEPGVYVSLDQYLQRYLDGWVLCR